MNQTIFNLLLCAALAGCGTSGSMHRPSSSKKSDIENWTALGGGPSRSGFRNLNFQTPLKQSWKISTSSAINSTIVIADSCVYFGTLDGRIYGVSIRNGSQYGKIRYVQSSVLGMTIARETSVYGLSNGKGTLVSYDLANARHNFIRELGAIETNPLVYDDYIYVGSLNKKFYCLNFSDGLPQWTFEASKPIRSSPAIQRNAVYFGCDNGSIYSMNRFNGGINWEFKTAGAVYATPVVDASGVYIGSLDGTFYAVGVDDGKLMWKFHVEEPLDGTIYAAAAVNDLQVFFGSTNGYLYALNKKDGSLAWRFKTNGAISTAPLISANCVFIGSQDKNFYAIDILSGNSSWSFKTNGRIKTNPAMYGNYIVIAAENNYVFALTTVDRKKNEAIAK